MSAEVRSSIADRETKIATGLSVYSPSRPLLLFTEFAPDAWGGGPVILRSILGPEERARMVWASVERSREGQAPNEVVLARGSVSRTGRRSFVRDLLHAKELADELSALAEARGAGAFWVVLHGVGVPVAAHLVRHARVPVHVSVHDDPPYGIALRSRRYVGFVPRLARDFAIAMRGAASIDVVSDAMVERYRTRYGVKSIAVRRALPPWPSRPARYDRAAGLSVGVLGNTYRTESLLALGRALGAASRALGVPGRLVILGERHDARRLHAALRGQIALETPGHLDETEAVARLRCCFLLYLNYPFHRRDAVLRRTSFPTKLTTYLMAERPLLVHAARDSSLAPFLAYDAYAFSWESMDVEEGARRLVACWSNRRLDESAADAAERVRLRYFDADWNRFALLSTLNQESRL